jgi:hypothetical protein
MPGSTAFVLAIICAQVGAWNDCEFPAVDYFAIDEGVGISYTYALAAMNGKMYSGGYTKGNFAFVGVKKDGMDVNPEPCQTLWGTTTSNIQNLYVAEVSSEGKMTHGWHFLGTAIQEGEIGHGPQTNSINAAHGMHRMLNDAHIAVSGGFQQNLTLPDGTLWSSALRMNPKDQVPYVIKLDVSSTQGVGDGTTGWAKQMVSDTMYPGGGSVHSVDGDAAGNMIVALKGCTGYDPTASGSDAYGRPTVGATTGCAYYLHKLSAANGADVWTPVELPAEPVVCRTVMDNSFFCNFIIGADETLDFGNGKTLNSTSSKIAIVKYSDAGVAQWAVATIPAAYSGDLSVNTDGSLLAVIGSPPRASRYAPAPPAAVARIDTSSGNEGTVLWTDNGGVGTHGFRGVEVTADPDAVVKEVVLFGQITGEETLSDTSGASTTLHSRGSYEVFVAAYDASDGTGKYAMDGGGTGMEYFFAFARDAVTNDVYVGGTSRSEKITWGNVERLNVMYNGLPGENNPQTQTAVGSSKAFVVKLKSQTELPDCLDACSATPTVKAGHCYIDRYCYAHEDASPFVGTECMQCDASANQHTWSGPVGIGSAHCMIGGSCIAADAMKSGSACEQCQPAVKSDGYTLIDGYDYVDGFGSDGCRLHDHWEVEAVRAGWQRPTGGCQASGNSRRKLTYAQRMNSLRGSNDA